MEDPIFFASAGELRAWLEANHATADRLWVGIHKRGSGKTGVSVREAQDQALCFGWIDYKGKRLDDDRFMLALTRRLPGSNWSPTNIGRANELQAQGLMHEAGLRAFEQRATD